MVKLSIGFGTQSLQRHSWILIGDVEEKKMKITLVIIFLPWERITRRPAGDGMMIRRPVFGEEDDRSVGYW